MFFEHWYDVSWILFSFSYNKKESDFATLRAYNDYLEEVESIGKFLIRTIAQHCIIHIMFMRESCLDVNHTHRITHDRLLSVFNLTNGTDLEDTKRKMDIYKKENQDIIKKNRSKLVS